MEEEVEMRFKRETKYRRYLPPAFKWAQMGKDVVHGTAVIVTL